MKKISYLYSAVALALTTSANAGTFQTITSESVGVEASSTGDLTANISGDSIVLQHATAMSADNRLFITLSNGATFADAGYSLEQSLGGAGTGDLTEFVLITPTPQGATTLEFRAASSISGTANFILSGSSIAGQAVTMNLPEGAAGFEIDMDANSDDSFGTFDFFTELELFQYVNEFSGIVDGVTDGIIDVDANRLSFTGSSTTEVIGLEFTEANVTNGVSLNDNDQVDIVLSGDMSGIGSITLKTDGITRGTFTIDSGAGTATFSASASDAFFTVPTSTTLELAVTGSSALATRSFTIQADLDLESETDKNIVAQGTSAGSWSINGLQAKVSHLSLNASGFVSWLKVVNEGSTAAEISADIIYTLADGTEGEVNSAALGTADAGGVATVSEAAILTAIGNPTGIVDASLTVTVAGQVTLVHLIAEKKASDGRVSIPVYYNTAGANQRNWVQ